MTKTSRNRGRMGSGGDLMGQLMLLLKIPFSKTEVSRVKQDRNGHGPSGILPGIFSETFLPGHNFAGSVPQPYRIEREERSKGLWVLNRKSGAFRDY